MTTTKKKQLEHVPISDQKDLEKWLQSNHKQKESVWLVYYKKSSEKSDLTISKIIDTLLCYGWVDSLPNKLDDQRTKLRVSPRNPKSNWSRVNKNKVARLIKEGHMKPPGMELIKIAKTTGTWDALNDVENLVIPEDLRSVLTQQQLLQKWEEKNRSFKRGWLERLFNAKRQETRDRIIKKIVQGL